MTVHIAIASRESAVLFSDSQGSTTDAESHGFHKQFVGANFLVGMAGAGDIIMRQFAHLEKSLGYTTEHNVKDVRAAIEQFFSDEVQPFVYGHCVTLLIGCDSHGNTSVSEFEPGKFKHFGPEQGFGTIGSGSQFVYRAAGRNQTLGIVFPGDQLEDLLFEALHYADAANESLTVDDSLAIAMIHKSRSYLTGDRSLRISHAPSDIRAHWNVVSPWWDQLRSTIRAINGQLTGGQRTFCKLQRAELTPTDLKAIETLNHGIQTSRNKLTQSLADFIADYDRIRCGSTTIP
ncbi:hypothetical protein LF1_07010 [Rubripirellula obstinata]|uniref:Proteasome subunit beta n=1 Tax=Rubripirellula obstinata TaxID=406547 RepID=A0A5B1CE97_9BACT|nr:hypothetical protein [Rubripirellula obstinata]KAA1258185.1 hypothetical protein LF1_07010 [Rubripirellula obstinata]